MTFIQPNEDEVLANMLRDAETLCGTNDQLMVGQYRFLADRIRALIDIRQTNGKPDTSVS